ncbi:PTS sugar transporter subunit IIA [bacterium]|nr:PTS sugar transporter subunit IIA [bacterium]
MKLAEYLSVECIDVGTGVKNKEDVLRQLAALACKHKNQSSVNENDFFKGFSERESMGSTGFGNGIAIPHFSSDKVDDFIVGLLTLSDGADFDSLDDAPAKLFVFIIAPTAKRNQHLGVLSNIARFLRQADHVKAILSMTSAETIYEYIINQQPEDKDVPVQMEHNLMTVVVQDEDSFSDVLDILAEVDNGHLSIIEANNAGKYLYHMPLFTSFWASDQKGFNRIIMAIVPRTQTNRALQKLNALIENLPEQCGVMALVQDLSFTVGSLDV